MDKNKFTQSKYSPFTKEKYIFFIVINNIADPPTLCLAIITGFFLFFFFAKKTLLYWNIHHAHPIRLSTTTFYSANFDERKQIFIYWRHTQVRDQNIKWHSNNQNIERSKQCKRKVLWINKISFVQIIKLVVLSLTVVVIYGTEGVRCHTPQTIK